MSNPSTELTVVQRAALALGTSEREKSLRELVAQSVTIVEIKNAAAREQCHRAAMVLRTERTGIRNVGKDARDDATKFSKAVIKEEDRLVAIIEPEETRLIGMRDEWDEARAAEKRAAAEKEAARIAHIREHIEDIRAIVSSVVGRPAAYIENEIKDLVVLQIDVARFAELTGEAEMARGITLEKLRELHAAAIAQEAEAKRLAEENERLARERAAFEEEQRRAAAERAEQERKDAQARAERAAVERRQREEREAAEKREREAREAQERAQREREEAARREQQAREDAERRAALEQQQRQLAAERAELARKQAEIHRAEEERIAREREALREMQEIRERAEREKKERERAENRAAMLAPEPTGGNWSVSVRGGGCIVTDAPIPGAIGTGRADVEAYGGYLIAESVYRPADAYVLAAAHDLYNAAQDAFMLLALLQQQGVDVSFERKGGGTLLDLEKVKDTLADAIDKATYEPELETVAA